jgi:tetraacyldisaccharide 4'-kinase
VWAEASHAPVAVRDQAGTRHGIDWLDGRRVAAFAGIGNPSAFRKTLTSLGAEIVAFRPYADHHAYAPADLTNLAAWGRAHDAVLVTTLKDLVKLPGGFAGETARVALEIAMVVETGEAELGGLLGRLAPVGNPRTEPLDGAIGR